MLNTELKLKEKMIFCFFFHQMGEKHAFLNYFNGKMKKQI